MNVGKIGNEMMCSVGGREAIGISGELWMITFISKKRGCTGCGALRIIVCELGDR